MGLLDASKPVCHSQLHSSQHFSNIGQMLIQYNLTPEISQATSALADTADCFG